MDSKKDSRTKCTAARGEMVKQMGTTGRKPSPTNERTGLEGATIVMQKVDDVVV